MANVNGDSGADMGDLDKVFNSPEAKYVGEIMAIDPEAKYAQIAISKDGDWHKVEYWVKTDKLQGDIEINPVSAHTEANNNLPKQETSK